MAPTTAATTAATTNAIIIKATQPISPRPSPEHGSLALLARPSPPKYHDRLANPILLRARTNLLAYLPGRKDHVLRSVTTATGRLEPSLTRPPRSLHSAAPEVESFLKVREWRFNAWRKKTGYSDCGGGLRWGNHALLTLRWKEVERMWTERVELARREDAELEDEKGEETEMRGWGMWARTKKKIKRVGRALGLDLREKAKESVDVEKVGDW